MKWEDYSSAKRRSSNRWASSDRGWLYGADRFTRGHYLDYGKDYYRSPHQYCQPGRMDCPECQPGHIHAVRFMRVDEYRTCMHESHWFSTIEEAKAWIEQATVVHAV